MPNVRIIAKGQRGDSLTKLKVNFAPSQSSTPSLMPETNTVYLTRPTEGTGELMELVGGSVAWNQLCNSSSVTGTSGHKFYLKKSGVESITNTDTFTGLASGTDMVIDLTQMLGPTIADYVYSLEQSTAGSGIAWLQQYGYFTEDYYAFSNPTLQSVEASAHVVVGKNLLNMVDVLPSGSYSGDTFTCSSLSNRPKVELFPTPTNIVFSYKSGSFTGGNARLLFFNKDTQIATKGLSESTPQSVAVNNVTAVKFDYGSAGTLTLEQPMIRLASVSDNAYAPYTKTTTALDSSVILRGMLKTDADGNLYYDGDTYEWDGTVTRKYGYRAYQNGDVSDGSTMITDGSHTVYKLNTPTTESADPFTAVQTVEDGGTEEFVTTNGVPVGVVGRFANAVPMEGVDSFSVTANDGTSHTYPVTLSEEIYRGYVDMLTGEAVSEAASIAEYNGETISEPWLSSLDVYSAGATPTNGAQVVYPITPEEVTATITGDPTELGKVTSASSTEGTVEWSAMAPLDGKCIVRVVS